MAAVGLAAAGALGGAGLGAVAAESPAPEPLTLQVGPEPDGTAVSIDATVYLPAARPAPAVLLAHGFGGSKDDLASRAGELAARGYVVAGATGHAGSAGPGAGCTWTTPA